MIDPTGVISRALASLITNSLNSIKSLSLAVSSFSDKNFKMIVDALTNKHNHIERLTLPGTFIEESLLKGLLQSFILGKNTPSQIKISHPKIRKTIINAFDRVSSLNLFKNKLHQHHPQLTNSSKVSNRYLLKFNQRSKSFAALNLFNDPLNRSFKNNQLIEALNLEKGFLTKHTPRLINLRSKL